MFKRKFKANLRNLFPLGGTGYVKDIPPSERIPPKSLGSAVPDPYGPLVRPAPNAFPLYYPGFKAQECKASVVSTPGIITGEPAPSLAMDATIDGHRYKGVLYLAEGEKDDPKGE